MAQQFDVLAEAILSNEVTLKFGSQEIVYDNHRIF